MAKYVIKEEWSVGLAKKMYYAHNANGNIVCGGGSLDECEKNLEVYANSKIDIDFEPTVVKELEL